ncbi:MAG: DUF2500 family protein [Armatimonadota bacterium]|nr:DUF2500 family protein [Armatimonadota bacterium]
MKLFIIGILIALYVVILWVLVFFALRRGYREWREGRSTRFRRVPACVMDKRRASEYSDAVGQPISRYFITFKYEGEQREFEVSEEIYTSTRIGGEGVLILKSENYQTFEPKSPGDETDEVYRRMVKW